MNAINKGPKLLRLHNQKQVLSLLRRTRITSRQDIARALSLSKNTISVIIDEMLENELIEVLGPVNVTVAGRPKIEIRLRAGKLKSAGIMIEKQMLHWRVCDYFSRIVDEGHLPAETAHPAPLLLTVNACCHELTQKYPELIGIALGLPGIVEPDRGWLHFSSHLGWQDVDLRTLVSQDLNVPLYIMNNVKAAALLPVQQLRLPAENSHFYLRIACGIGGALVQHGKVFTGNSWTAGEVGHLIVQPDGPVCHCGRRGCLEALISQPAIAQQLTQRQAGLSWQRRDREPAIVREVMAQAGGFLGQALSQIMLLINPASIIMDCPWSAHPVFCSTTRDATEACSLSFPFRHTDLYFLQEPIDPASGLALAVIEAYERSIA